MKPITHLFVAGLLLLAHSLAGQMTTTFAPTTVTAAVGTSVQLQLKVTGFTNIASLQFPVPFNNTILQFDSISQSPLPGFNVGNYLPPSFANQQGRAVVSWFADQTSFPNGFTLPANTSVFTMYFKVIGSGVQSINLANLPGAPIEVIKAGGQLVTVNYQNGASVITAGGGNPPPPPITGFHIIADGINIPQGTVGCMPVRVNDFDGIVAMQYAMHWNTTVLELVTPPAGPSTQAYNLPSLGASNFNATTPGTLVLAWEDPTTLGVTRPDLAKIYEVCFKAIGAPGTQTLVNFDGVGLPPSAGGAEAINSSGTSLWVSLPASNPTGITDTVFVVQAPALVTFMADPVVDTVTLGQVGCVDVRASNFTDIMSAQFGMTYDQTRFQYQSVQLGTNPLGLTGQVTNPAAGQISFDWNGTGTPATVTNNAVLFSVCFTAVGQANNCSALTFAGLPGMPIEVIKSPNVPVTPILNHGSMCTKAPQTPIATPTVAQNVTCNGGSNGSINLNVTNCGNMTFSWTGPNSFVASTQNISGLKAGTYNVTVTCSGGGTTSTSAVVSQPAAITLGPGQIAVTNVACPNGANGTINITPAGGTPGYSYNWTSTAAGFTPPAPPGLPTLTNLRAGSYSVTITDNAGCSLAPSSAIVVTAPSQIAVATNITAVGCGGNGSINTTTNGGTPNYTYAWSGPAGFTANTSNISNLGVGVYNLTVTDAQLCSQTFGPYQVTQSGTPPTVTLGQVINVSCLNGANGGGSINITGGLAPYGVQWFNFQNVGVATGQTVNTLAAGVYHLVVTDAANCTASLANITVNGPSAMLSAGTPATTPVSCPGASTGAITLAASGGWSTAYTYAWPPPLTPGCCQNNVPAGTYVATVTDAGGCTATATATVTSPSVIGYATSPTVNHVSCFGTATGSITINPNGGNGSPYSVMWNGQAGLTGTTISTLQAGTYIPVITDPTGCTAAMPAITVNGPANAVSVTPAPVNIPIGGTGSITLTVNGGTAPYTYNWSGPGAFASTQQNINNLTEAGTYTVTVTDAAGCSVVKTENIITEDDEFGNSTIVSTSGSCGNNGCVTIAVPAGSAAPFTVEWNGTASGQHVTSDFNILICTFAPGAYNFTITDFNGQEVNLGSELIDQMAPALATSNVVNPSNDLCNGAITMTPFGGNMNFQWTGPGVNGSTAAALSGLCEGTFTVAITNPVSGCTSTQSFTVGQVYPPHNGTISNTVEPTCATAADGSLNYTMEGGNPPFQYQWSGPNGFSATGQNIIGLLAGTYTVTVTDEDGVTSTDSKTIDAQSHLAITNVNELSNYNGFQVSGDSICDGAAQVAFSGQSGNASILWSDGTTAALTNTLCGGQYSVTVTDALGCSTVWTDLLTAPAPVVASAQITTDYNDYAVSCHEICDGSAAVTVAGGKAPYTVQWPTGQVDQLVAAGMESEETGLCGGTYTVTITDFNNVNIFVPITLTEPDPLEVAFSTVEPSSYNNCNGEVLAQVSGAVGQVEYSWLGTYGHAGDAQRAEGLCSGENVHFIIIDENGCRIEVTTKAAEIADGCMQVRPVLTPGEQDGKNDYLLIACAESYPVNSIEIYNRWGQLVFETENYSNDETSPNCWKGTNKNDQPLAEGVYFYVLRYIDIVNGEDVEEKGHINLLR